MSGHIWQIGGVGLPNIDGQKKILDKTTGLNKTPVGTRRKGSCLEHGGGNSAPSLVQPHSWVPGLKRAK